MVTESEFKKIALALANVSESPHFEKKSFRIGKKILATLDGKSGIATLKLSLINQSVFNTYDPEIFYPVPNAWGKKGWTHVQLKKVRKDMLKDVLSCAHAEVTIKSRDRERHS